MRNPGWRLSALSILLALVARHSSAAGPGKSSDPPKKILVELYTSQGCNSCPPASDLLGKLARLGYGPDQIVPLNFHVDYFNQPWVDPFSDAEYSRRQLSYNDVRQRDDLYFTPLMMVDGRYPLLGSDRPKALAALAQARKEAPGVKLEIALNGAGRRKTLSVKLAPQSAAATGRDLLVGTALTEDPVTTKVLSGENGGRTLVEHNVVRRFAHKMVRLEQDDSKSVSFPLELAEDWEPERFRATVFVQDRLNGKVYQADSVPWNSARTARPRVERTSDPDRTIAKGRVRRTATRSSPEAADFLWMMSQRSSFDMTTDPTTCSTCGSEFSVQSLYSSADALKIPSGW